MIHVLLIIDPEFDGEVNAKIMVTSTADPIEMARTPRRILRILERSLKIG